MTGILKCCAAKAVGTHDQDDPLDWWQTAVFYQIYPRSFKDSNGDGVGDLKGIEEKADHFKDLGIDCVWLSPIFKSPMADFGYDISDYNQVDGIFGTFEDFESLQKKLNDLDVKLILDFVPNHSSDEHEWFKKSVENIAPYSDFYIWKDGKTDEKGNRIPPNNWQSMFSNSAWTWNEKRGQYYLHQFDTKQPDLNYRNKQLVENMKDNLRFWLDRGVDGYRVDAVPYLFEDTNFSNEPERLTLSSSLSTYELYDHPFTKDLPETYDMISEFRSVMDEYKNKDGRTRVMIAEAYTTIENTMRYYGNELSPGAHMPFNFGLIDQINDHSNAKDFSVAVHTWLDKMPQRRNANWVVGNHDQPRVATRLGREMVDGMNMLNLLLPGAAFTYMGEEIGMEDNNIRWDQTVDPSGLNAGSEGYRSLSRDPCRNPYQWNAQANGGFSSNLTTWLPLNPNYWSVNLEAQKKQNRSHYSVYKRLIKLKKTRTIQRGSFEDHILSPWVFAFTRTQPGSETYLVVLNVGSEEEQVDLSAISTSETTWFVHTPSVNSQYSTGDKIKTNGLTMRPKSSLVLTNKKICSRPSCCKIVMTTAVVVAIGWAMFNRFPTIRNRV